MKHTPSILATRRKFESENLAWAREHLARWQAAGCPRPDGLTQVAQRTLARHTAQEPQPSLFAEVMRDE